MLERDLKVGGPPARQATDLKGGIRLRWGAVNEWESVQFIARGGTERRARPSGLEGRAIARTEVLGPYRVFHADPCACDRTRVTIRQSSPNARKSTSGLNDRTWTPPVCQAFSS